MMLKTKRTEKLFQSDPEFALQWVDGRIDLTRSVNKLIKLLRPKSARKANCSQSPLTWFVDESASVVKKVDQWYEILLGQKLLGQKELRKHFVDIQNSVKLLTDESLGVGESGGVGSVESELGFNSALIAIAACHSIRAVAVHCRLAESSRLVARLLEIAMVADANVSLTPSVYQILAVEIPLTIAFQIPEIEDDRQLAIRSSRRLEVSLQDMLDHDGWPHARYLDEFGLLAASWIRCGLLLQKMKVELDPELESQLEWVVRQLLRLTGPDGRLVFSTSRQRPWSATLSACLKRVSRDSDDKKILKSRRVRFRSAKESEPKKSKPQRARTRKITPVGSSSDWSESGILRSHWGLDSPLVGFDYSSNSIRLSIARSERLILGIAMPEILINSKAVVPDRDVEVVCQQSDKDIEYVELETDLGEGAVFNRQILLSRDEEFLLIADVVVPSGSAKIEYRCQYPLAPGVLGMQETENREVYLRTGEIQSLVLPVALPEWKVARSGDRLEFDESSLWLVQSANGRGLYAPLFFDLNPNRSRQKRTWRQLTVGENLTSVSRDVACAYRVQLDEQQWFFYRAISGQGNRTFLGENVTGEFVFGRFKKDGTVTPLLVI